MRLLLLILAMLIVSIPTINGETSIGGGPSVSVGEKSTAQGAFMTDGEVSKSSLAADAVKQISSFQWVQSARGDYVSHFIQVDNGVGVSYNQYGSGPGNVPVLRPGYVFREEYLDVDDADYILAYAHAQNSAGDEAEARLEIYNGYLTDYFNSGFAGPFPPWDATEGAFAAQSFGDAAGDEIHFYSYGKDADNDYGAVDTDVLVGLLVSHDSNRDGCLDGLCYGSQSAGHEHPDGHGEAGTMLYGGYGYTQNGEITQQMTARNGEDNECVVGTDVYKGYFENAGYSLWAYSITDWDITRAIQYVEGSSYSGAGTYIEEFALLNTFGYSDKYQELYVKFWDESNIATGITHGYW